MITVLPMYAPIPLGAVAIDTTSKSGTWSALSPFTIGPCIIPGHGTAANMEGAWQFSKIYAQHTDADGDPTEDYFAWARAGWADRRAQRYPMGKGAVPLYSLWNDERLGYINARKRIYGPLYIAGVTGSAAFDRLAKMHADGDDIVLRDYDAYDHRKLGMTLVDVIHCRTRKMGHAFVLMSMLTGEGLEEFDRPE